MITQKIKNALADVSLPAYFITRANDKTDCIVYNYIEKPSRSADNEEKATLYTVMLNLYCKSNIENNKKKNNKCYAKCRIFKKVGSFNYSWGRWLFLYCNYFCN